MAQNVASGHHTQRTKIETEREGGREKQRDATSAAVKTKTKSKSKKTKNMSVEGGTKITPTYAENAMRAICNVVGHRFPSPYSRAVPSMSLYTLNRLKIGNRG